MQYDSTPMSSNTGNVSLVLFLFLSIEAFGHSVWDRAFNRGNSVYNNIVGWNIAEAIAKNIPLSIDESFNHCLFLGRLYQLPNYSRVLIILEYVRLIQRIG